MSDLISREEAAKRLEAIAEKKKGSFSGEAFAFAAKIVRGVPAAYEPHWATEQAYKNGYETGKPKWIPVSERLPEKDDRYATVCDFGHGVVSRGVLGFAKDFSKVATYQTTAKDVWYEYDREYGFVMITYVTHWMPLPEPPKGE